MMRRKIAAVLAALALAACFGRVAAWASTPGEAHACCAPTKAPVLSDCCAIPAAVAPVETPLPDLVFVAVAVFKPAPSVFVAAEIENPAPPGPQTLCYSVPARAPPIA